MRERMSLSEYDYVWVLCVCVCLFRNESESSQDFPTTKQLFVMTTEAQTTLYMKHKPHWQQQLQNYHQYYYKFRFASRITTPTTNMFNQTNGTMCTSWMYYNIYTIWKWKKCVVLCCVCFHSVIFFHQHWMDVDDIITFRL